MTALKSKERSTRCVRWILDVNKLWPGDDISVSAWKALELVGEEERQKVLAKHFVQDARMTLGSALIKRLFLCKVLGEPWDASGKRFGRRGHPRHGKPSVQRPGTYQPYAGVDFNVSHQGGLVCLVGSVTDHPDANDRIEVGVDITCVNERNDMIRIEEAGGFDEWVSIFDQVFSPNELQDLRERVDVVRLSDGTDVAESQIHPADIQCCRSDPNRRIRYDLAPVRRRGTFGADDLVYAKLRRFFGFYAYREAFVKLTGDALLAEWLSDMEFKNVKSPAPGRPGKWGGSVGSVGRQLGEPEDNRYDDLEIWQKSKKVMDMHMQLRAWGETTIIATAARRQKGGPIQWDEWEQVDLHRDLELYGKVAGG